MTAQAKSAQAKAALRKRMRAWRRGLGADTSRAAADSAASALADSSRWAAARHIAVYQPNDGEIDTAPLVEAARREQRALYLPRVRGNTLEFALWEEHAELAPNRFGIGEPRTAPVAPTLLDLIVVPTVAFGDDGGRVGMGGGYYDRTLAGCTRGARPLLLGLAYDGQRAAVETERWDVMLDAVLTEKGLRVCSRRW